MGKFNLKDYRSNLKKILIEKDEQAVLQDLTNRVRPESESFNQIILLQRRLIANQRARLQQTIIQEDYTTEQNKINDSLLDLIDNLSLEDIILASTEVDIKEQKPKIQEIPSSVFLSTPLASMASPHELDKMIQLSQDIQDVLRYDLDINIIYYAGNTIKSLDDFHTPAASIKQDFKAIQSCESFLLVYPEPLPTSSLIEIGYAIALQKNCVIFTRDRKELPFLLQEADTVFRNIQIVEYAGIEKIPELLKQLKLIHE